MRRRAYLATVGFAVAALAGCLDGDSTDDGSDADETGSEQGNERNPDAGAGDGNGADTGTDGADESTKRASTVHEEYETTAVTVTSPGGSKLGAVTAAVADTGPLRYLGLSDTEFLPADRGMLFVYGAVGEHTFVMRDMDFGIDIVYADADGTITEIHHAPAPGPDEDGSTQTYPGTGQYVLEVGYEWTADRGITEGDVLSFDLPA